MPKKTIDQIVATRELTDAKEPKSRIIISLGMPQITSRGDWVCDVHIDGAEVFPEQVRGVDSLDALMNGINALRWSLMHSGRTLAWPDTGIPCFSGEIPRQVPTALGEEFDKRIEKLIGSEAPRLLRLRKKMVTPYLERAAKAMAASQKTASTRRQRRSD